jgi:hypothetical protein
MPWRLLNQLLASRKRNTKCQIEIDTGTPRMENKGRCTLASRQTLSR